MTSKWEAMKDIAQRDLEALKKAETSYGDSWKRRGGVGVFLIGVLSYRTYELTS